MKYDSNVVTLISLDKSIVEEAFRHAMKRIEFEYDRFGLNLEKRIAMIHHVRIQYWPRERK